MRVEADIYPRLACARGAVCAEGVARAREEESSARRRVGKETGSEQSVKHIDGRKELRQTDGRTNGQADLSR